MKRLFGAGILLTVLGASSMNSAAEASTSPDAPATAAAEEAQVASVVAARTASNLQFVAFSVACRFLDTRVAGGAFRRNESRDLGVLDASIPPGLGPCGVPAGAKAVLLSLSALKGTTTAVGSARVGPGAGPTVVALQFQKGLGSTATTVVPLNGSSEVRITSAAAGAGYVGYLLGYYEDPVWAVQTDVDALKAANNTQDAIISSLLLGTAMVPSGQTITGYGAFDHSVIADNEDVFVAVQLSGRASAPLSPDKVNFAPNPLVGDSDPECAGTVDAPTAPPGKVCLYLGMSFHVDGLSGTSAVQTGFDDRFFLVYAYANGTPGTDLYFRFSWAYHAP